MAAILLIDDSAVQLRIRQTVLERAGFNVLSATDADAAFALMRSEAGASINAVVTDHVMPDVSGSELVRHLRGLSADIPVVVISGLPEAIEEYAGLNVHFRYKPCQPAELIELLRTVTAESRFSATA